MVKGNNSSGNNNHENGQQSGEFFRPTPPSREK